MASAYLALGLGMWLPPPRRSRSFADLRPVAIHFHRSREQPRERIGTVQLMGVPPATRPSAASGSQLEPKPLVRRNEDTVIARQMDGDNIRANPWAARLFRPLAGTGTIPDISPSGHQASTLSDTVGIIAGPLSHPATQPHDVVGSRVGERAVRLQPEKL